MVALFGAFVQEEAKTGRGAFPITAKMQSILQLNDPEHRLAKHNEQAAVILFLLSDDASYLTGRVYATGGAGQPTSHSINGSTSAMRT
jgi:NAD(P)-dependent dehydrogenase (short-subunit alcohol dehydrogenase family)